LPIIRHNVRALGLRMEDIKIMLNSQAHFDHVAGQRDLQKLTGAQIYSSAKEVDVLESGGVKDPRWATNRLPVGFMWYHVVKDGEKVNGRRDPGRALTPGHSQGCTTWTMTVTTTGKTYDVGSWAPPGILHAAALEDIHFFRA